MKDFLSKRKIYFYLFLGAIFCAIWIYDFHLLGLLDRETPKGFIHDFQVLIGGFLAFGAGAFVWVNGYKNREREDKKDKEISRKYRKYYAKEAVVIASKTDAIITAIDTRNNDALKLMDFNYSEKFLKEDKHIYFFNQNEISKICKLEMMYSLINISAKSFTEFIHREDFDFDDITPQLDPSNNYRTTQNILIDLAQTIDGNFDFIPSFSR